jgi:hypothetical protein
MTGWSRNAVEREYVHKRIVKERTAMHRLLMLNTAQTAQQAETQIAAVDEAK